jgi:hypothetical protein
LRGGASFSISCRGVKLAAPRIADPLP